MPFRVSQGPAHTGLVLMHHPDRDSTLSVHEEWTLQAHAASLARLLGARASGVLDLAARPAERVYLLPTRTLLVREAAALGLRGPQDLFGGVVPHAFVSTKAISHPLVARGAAAPDGWNPDLALELDDTVLAGHAAFALDDALLAGERLLARGATRIKPVLASGGHGQRVVHDAIALRQALLAMPAGEIESVGVVLEEDLHEAGTTLSVGQVTVAGLRASYFGFQTLTRDNHGQEGIFGGSDLVVVRGDYDALLAREIDPVVRSAVELARRYDAAVEAAYPGFYASRRNYDVLVGRDASDTWRSGVLEQSWRAGGATGAELAALERLQAEPGLSLVRAATVERFGPGHVPPAGAQVQFHGVDPQVGPLLKYTLLHDKV